MSDFNGNDISQSFDQDFGGMEETSLMTTHPTTGFDIIPAYFQSPSIPDFIDSPDPLKHAYQISFEPFHLDLGNNHFVKPHYVKSYIRKDGTLVDGYYRDGDGNSATHLTQDLGGGYIRSNPDGNPFNNLK